LGDDIAHVFAAVLAICDAQGLIGREMFAIDGVKLPSNASKQRSGTRTDFARQATKLEAAAATMLARHRANDALPVEPALEAKAVQRVERLTRDAAQLRDGLAPHTLVAADAGYHSEANLQALATLGVDALIADTAMRRRAFSRATSSTMPPRAPVSVPRASRCTEKDSRA